MVSKDIYSIVTANKALAKSHDDVSESMMASLSSSKAWNFVSRMTSGSGFWKIQNKVRAITDAYVVMDKAMQQSIETQNEAMDVWAKLRKAKKNMPMRDSETGEYKADKIKNTKEFKSQIGAYTSAMGGDKDKGEAALTVVLEKQLDNQHKLMKKMAKDQIDQIKYDSYGWRLDKKMAFKTRKYMKLVGGMVKKAMMFLVQASVGMLLLILAIPVIIAFAKNFKGFLDGMGIEVGLKDVKKAFKFIKKILVSFVEMFKLLFKGDWNSFKEAMKIYLFDIVIPIGKVVKKGLIKLIEIIAALFAALVKTIWNGVAKAINKVLGKFTRKRLPTLATGGKIKKSGLAIVGEKGAEVVSLPSGATVHSNSQSKSMMGGNTIHVHVNGRVGASDAEIKDIARKVAREIGLQMNRTSSAVGRF